MSLFLSTSSVPPPYLRSTHGQTPMTDVASSLGFVLRSCRHLTFEPGPFCTLVGWSWTSQRGARVVPPWYVLALMNNCCASANTPFPTLGSQPTTMNTARKVPRKRTLVMPAEGEEITMSRWKENPKERVPGAVIFWRSDPSRRNKKIAKWSVQLNEAPNRVPRFSNSLN